MMRKKPCRERAGKAAKDKGPGFQSREFSSTRWMQTGPRGSTPASSRAVRSGPAAGTQTALTACRLGSFSPSPLSRPRGPSAPGGKTGKRSPLQPLNAGIAGLGTDYTEEEDWKDQAPLLWIIAPDGPLGVWETNACRICPPFWRSGWIFVVPGLGQVQNDGFQTSGAEKHRIRWRQQDLALDLTHRGLLSRCQTKSSPVWGLGWTGPDSTSTTWRGGPQPCQSLTPGPSDHLESGDNEGPSLDLFIEPARGSCRSPGGACTLSGVLALAADLEESEVQGPWESDLWELPAAKARLVLSR